MSVAENMGFALKIKGTPKDEIATRVKEAAKILDLEQYLERKPKALSGGQRQRVAMGRAIVRQPQVFLMDEPLSNLDAKLRVSTRTQIASLQRRLGITTLYVTHDQTEAMTMGDRVAVLKDGLLQQVDTPLNLYDTPGNVFVAGFIGSPAMNIADFDLKDGFAQAGQVKLRLPEPVAQTAARDGRITVGFRPEGLDMAEADAENAFPVDVDIVEELGSDAFVYGVTAGDATAAVMRNENIIARIDPHIAPRKGDHVWLAPKENAMHYFSASTGARIDSESGQLVAQ
jgi:multiple sugar transport system ATP-binding protein